MTDEQYTGEAERALAQFMETQRQKQVVSDLLSSAFRDGESYGRPVSGTETVSNYEEAKQAAKEYAQARNSNARVRHYAQDNESQRQGVASALAWLDRKRKSGIRN
jgi:hypothetical protein